MPSLIYYYQVLGIALQQICALLGLCHIHRSNGIH